jgi:hypothetical protein
MIKKDKKAHAILAMNEKDVSAAYKIEELTKLGYDLEEIFEMSLKFEDG